MVPPTNILDHIVHLSPPGKLSEAITHWERLGFKVIPGGTHTTGLSSNALVPLADGSYIELLALENPLADLPASDSWWAKKHPGWIVWACLGLEDHINETIAEREKGFNSRVQYQKEYEGGRKRESDGKELKWRVTLPKEKHGTLPFFCQDLTPREWRSLAADLDTHTNTAVGIAHFHLSVPRDQLEQVRAQLSVVLDSQPNESDEWELVVPHGRYNPAPRLKLAGSPDEIREITEVGFYVEKARDDDEAEGLGKVVFKEL